MQARLLSGLAFGLQTLDWVDLVVRGGRRRVRKADQINAKRGGSAGCCKWLREVLCSDILCLVVDLVQENL